MPHSPAPARSTLDLAGREVVFDLQEARRALPYVARIVRDAANAFHSVRSCRLALQDQTTRQRALLDERRDEALRKLNSAIDECNAVGADLLNIPEGIVRFNAVVAGRRASLVWRLNEPIDGAWDGLADT